MHQPRRAGITSVGPERNEISISFGIESNSPQHRKIGMLISMSGAVRKEVLLRIPG
jgi:hypothetical protein